MDDTYVTAAWVSTWASLVVTSFKPLLQLKAFDSTLDLFDHGVYNYTLVIGLPHINSPYSDGILILKLT